MLLQSSDEKAVMRAAIRKLGNSSGVIIPKSMLTEIGISAGDPVDLSLEDGRIAITPLKRRPREGWAGAFGEIEELGEEDRAWLEFGNDGDAELEW
jgi:antitoxin MazE